MPMPMFADRALDMNVVIPARIASSFVPPEPAASAMDPETSANRYKLEPVHPVHVPFEQIPLQTLLQAPQLSGSFIVSVHPVVHGVPKQVQNELTHEYPAAHVFPHPPQFAVSVVVSTQTLLQVIAFAGQTH